MLKKKIWLISAVLFFLISIIFPPKIIQKNLLKQWSKHDKDVEIVVNKKIANPFWVIDGYSEKDHMKKRTYRLTPILIGNLFNLSYKKLFFLQFLSFFLFIYLLLKITFSIFQNQLFAILGTCSLLFSYAGLSFNFDTLFFDSFGYLFLLLGFYFRKTPWTILFLLLAFFVDERTYLGSIPIVIVDYLEEKSLTKVSVYLFISILLALASRYLLTYFLNMSIPKPILLEALMHHQIKTIFALFFSFKILNFLFFPLGYFKKIYQQYSLELIGIYAFLGLLIIQSVSVEDMTRSFAYGFLIFFPIFKILKEIFSTDKLKIILLVLAIGNIMAENYTFLAEFYKIDAFPYLYLLDGRV